jgi:hypothetical protein
MTISEILYCLFLGIAMIVAVSILLNEKRAGISPTPTMPRTRRVVIDLLEKHADARSPLRIAELGSGWGGLAIKLAKAFPTATITGCEISPWPLLVSRIMTMFNARIMILREDFFERDLTQYDALICYLSPQHMQRIEAALHNVKNKPLVISCAFPMRDTPPSDVVTIRQLVNVSVYVYHSRIAV